MHFYKNLVIAFFFLIIPTSFNERETGPGEVCLHNHARGACYLFKIYFMNNIDKLCGFFSGVYFTSRVKHVKFVDFCGKYHIPLQEYLCSPTCTDYPAIWSSSSEDESEEEVDIKIKKVLLG